MSDMSHCLGRLIESEKTSWDFLNAQVLLQCVTEEDGHVRLTFRPKPG